MFAALVVGLFILMIFTAELYKMWRRETEYRRARAQWDDDVEELQQSPGNRPAGQRPAPGYVVAAAARHPPLPPRRTTPPMADIQTRIQRELRAMHQDAQTFEQLLEDMAPEVYPHPLELEMAHDSAEEDEVQPRPTH